MSLTDDLTKVIDSNLPAEVSKRLQERLKLADVAEGRQHKIDELRDTVNRQQEEIAKHRELDERVETVQKARAALTERENLLQQNQLLDALRVENAEARRQDTWRMLELLLANRTYRERVQDKIPLDMGAITEYANAEAYARPQGECLADAERTTEREEG